MRPGTLTRAQLEDAATDLASHLVIVMDGKDIHYRTRGRLVFSPVPFSGCAYAVVAAAAEQWDLDTIERYEISACRETEYAPDYSWRKPGFVAKVWDNLHNDEVHRTDICTGPGAKSRSLKMAAQWVFNTQNPLKESLL